MGVSLRPVTTENYEDVCDLEVTEAQQDYVAENMWSLVESHYNEGYTTRVIYQDEQVVGFFMWVLEKPGSISIWRFMLDAEHQQKGIGRLAMQLALEEIQQIPGLKEIEICYNPQNPVAKDFYSSFGFVEVGMDKDDEDMLAVIKLAKQD